MLFLRAVPRCLAVYARSLLVNTAPVNYMPQPLLTLRGSAKDANHLEIRSSRRRYASRPDDGASRSVPEVSYEDVCRSLADPAHLLVDVREPHELAEGHIPSAINIPLGEVRAALDTSTSTSTPDFEARFGRRAPGAHTHITFYCQVGKRSHAAATIAHQLGYHNSKNYLGSYNEWASKNKKSS